MKLSQNQANFWSITLFASWIILTILGAVYLFETLQSKYAGVKQPGLIPTFLMAVIYAAVSNFLTYVGFNLSKLKYFNQAKTAEVNFKEIILSKIFLTLQVAWLVGALIVLFLWRADLP